MENRKWEMRNGATADCAQATICVLGSDDRAWPTPWRGWVRIDREKMAIFGGPKKVVLYLSLGVSVAFAGRAHRHICHSYNASSSDHVRRAPRHKPQGHFVTPVAA